MSRAPLLFAMLVLGLGLSAEAVRAQSDADVQPVEDPAQFKSPLKERPLFSPTRTPPLVPEVVEQAPEDPQPEVVAETPPPPWRLVGIVQKSSGAIAIFAVEGGRSFQLRQGDERDGWQLAEVGRREAVLREGTRVHTVKFGAAGRAAAPGGNPAGPAGSDMPFDPNAGIDPNVIVDPNGQPLDANGMPIDPAAVVLDANGNPVPVSKAPRPRRDNVRKVGERPPPPQQGAVDPGETIGEAFETVPQNGGPFDVNSPGDNR